MTPLRREMSARKFGTGARMLRTEVCVVVCDAVNYENAGQPRQRQHSVTDDTVRNVFVYDRRL